MPIDPKRTRRVFLGIAILLTAVVIGFYSYARWKVNQQLKKLPEKLGVEVQQTTQGFTFTKSDRGRKQFSISADKAIQYKAGQKARLQNVRIIVYGRGINPNSGHVEDKYDQIFGKEFEYDPASGDVRANDVVDIDLEHHGQPSNDPMQAHAEPGSIHLKASGLVFNQKSGMAETKEQIEFALPQASGSAVGATYDSKDMVLTLQSKVDIVTSAQGTAHSDVNLNAAHIRAAKAVISDSPRKADLMDVNVIQGEKELTASVVQIYLRPNSTVDHVDAVGVSAKNKDAKSAMEAHSRAAKFTFGAKNQVESAVLTNEVRIDSTGALNLNGAAERTDVLFAAGNIVRAIHASGNVKFEQRDQAGQTTALQAPAVDFAIKNNAITGATTKGASQIVLTQAQTKTTVTADEFDAKFVSGNRISTLHGTSNAKVVFAGSQPGAERTTTSDEVIAKFSTSPRRANQIESVEQTGNFHYAEGVRKASAERARYTPQDETIVATGNPRFEDPGTGLQVSAETLRFHRRNNTVDAQGSVKTTYAPAKAQAGGGMLAGSEPVHVTAQTGTATTNGRATFTGNARLWQGTSIIEAATIDFDRNARTVIASGPAARRVQVNFTQADTAGKQIPVTVTAGKLVYNDAQRKAVFTDSVQAVGADMTMTARQMDVLLKPRGQSASGNGQLDQIIASGNVQLDEKNPVRKGQGERLVYTAERSKFVLSSVPGKTASIFDAEHGKIEADSLTFFSRDDTVQVGSGENSRVVTKTRIKEDSRP